MLTIEHCPPHLYECLWRNYFRTRNIVTLLLPVYLSCLWVVATHHEPSDHLETCCVVASLIVKVAPYSFLTTHELISKIAGNVVWVGPGFKTFID